MLKKLCLFFSCQLFLFQQWIKKQIHFKFKKPLALIFVYSGIALRTCGRPQLGLNFILKGRRINNVKKANSIIKYIVNSSYNEIESLLPVSDDVDTALISRRILILKNPELAGGHIIEKGAIVIKFSETFSLVYSGLDVKHLSDYFNIILEPSSVGYSVPEILVWTKLDPVKVYVMSPFEDDYNFILNIDKNLVPLKLGPSDWVNRDVFFRIDDTEKYYDAIYIANYNPIKRVERFILAVFRIQKIRPGFRAALVLAGHGDKKKQIKDIISRFERSVNIDYFDAMGQDQLNVILNRSKVNMLISFREGSNKGLAEGLFSGTPALLMAENSGGNHVHMNEFTGKVVKDRNLESAMLWFSDNYQELSPDAWVQQNMSPEVSAAKLSSVLKKYELDDGQKWERELIPKVNSPELSYVDPEYGWLSDKRMELLETFSEETEKRTVNERMINFIIDAKGNSGTCRK